MSRNVTSLAIIGRVNFIVWREFNYIMVLQYMSRVKMQLGIGHVSWLTSFSAIHKFS